MGSTHKQLNLDDIAEEKEKQKEEVKLIREKETVLLALIELLKVKTIITLALIGVMCYLAVMDKISSEAFMGVAGSVITHYFTRNNAKA